MGIHIKSEIRNECGSFLPVLDIQMGDACWTHTALAAASILRALAVNSAGDYHRITVQLIELCYEWEGRLNQDDPDLDEICMALERMA